MTENAKIMRQFNRQLRKNSRQINVRPKQKENFIFEQYCTAIKSELKIEDKDIFIDDGNSIQKGKININRAICEYRVYVEDRERMEQMIATLQYRKTKLMNMQQDHPTILRYNKNRKEEICCIFRIRTRCNRSYDCLKERHLVVKINLLSVMMQEKMKGISQKNVQNKKKEDKYIFEFQEQQEQRDKEWNYFIQYKVRPNSRNQLEPKKNKKELKLI